MPRGIVSEEKLVAQLAKVEEKRRVLRKKLQVFRIRAAAKKRKAVFSSIRKNEKEVMEVLKNKAPDFFKKLLTAQPAKRGRRKKAAG
ncbi:MAG TPA: hypothetical protein VHE37_06760 [Nevskiaceae bacterium]|nr:hypothetical protein [Nevskiaceae bacterium]